MLREPVLYPTAYLLYVLAAVLDITFTWWILQLGGHEVNPVAALALDSAGLSGMVLLKYITVVLVIGSCEYIGRHRPDIGLRIADGAAAIHLIPIAAAVGQLTLFFA